MSADSVEDDLGNPRTLMQKIPRGRHEFEKFPDIFSSFAGEYFSSSPGGKPPVSGLERGRLGRSTDSAILDLAAEAVEMRPS